MASRPSVFLAAFLSVVVALVSYRFLAQGLAPAFPSMFPHIESSRLAFLIHISASPVALALGAFQFLPGLRIRRPAFHRWSGRLYGVAILLGGIGALGMLPNVNGGAVSQVGFGLLAFAWIGTTVNAVRLAMARRLDEHQQWMVRSFALTFAAVTLRLELAPIMAAGMDYVDAIRILAWLAWVPNLLVAEFWLWHRRTQAHGDVVLDGQK